MMLATSKRELLRYMADNPGAVFEEAAKLHGVTPRETVMPAAMRRLAPANLFADVMGDIAAWGDVTLIVRRRHAFGAHCVFQYRWRHHVQGVRRPRRQAGAQEQSACGVSRTRRTSLFGLIFARVPRYEPR